ncbi:unnamed protein product [Sphenostylis stenocarpa]|uniref:Uncharacterized protein n=1 Tax=Sphenostylis stenocarpa TaxID=92480 RepID=A0AA86W635_9FABA|nr:unnamed protein product [Sphenostylis stenocarpa]
MPNQMAQDTGSSADRVSTDKHRNYAVVANTITILGALGWYLKITAKKAKTTRSLTVSLPLRVIVFNFSKSTLHFHPAVFNLMKSPDILGKARLAYINCVVGHSSLKLKNVTRVTFKIVYDCPQMRPRKDKYTERFRTGESSVAFNINLFRDKHTQQSTLFASESSAKAPKADKEKSLSPDSSDSSEINSTNEKLWHCEHPCLWK